MTNKEFYISIGLHEIPWDRIPTHYGRATDFPKLFGHLVGHDILKYNASMKQIQKNIIHQDSLCLATPFALIFLMRCRAFTQFDTIATDKVLSVCKQATDFQLGFYERDELYQKVRLLPEMLQQDWLLPPYKEGEDEQKLWQDYDFGASQPSIVYHTERILISNKSNIS